MIETCGDCIHADVCKAVNGGWFSPKNPAYCKLFKNKDVPSKWISVKDELPEIKMHGTSDVVLAYEPGHGRCFALIYDNGESKRWFYSGRECPNVTHWMPLPKPPKED